MISAKGHDMICKLMTAAGQATDKDAMVNSWTDIEDYISQLEQALTELYVTSGPVANCAYNVGQQQEDWENIRHYINQLDKARSVAINVIQEKK